MSEEPEITPTTHDTETPTDDVGTPATEDTKTSEPAKNQRRYTFLSRHISTLRALRLGGAFTIVTAIVLAIMWWAQLTLLWGIAFPYFWFTLAILALWPLGAQLKPLKRTFAALTAVCTIVAVGAMGQQWWLIHEQTSIWIGLLPVQALATCGLGVFVVSDVLLRGIRTQQNTPPGDPDDPARYRPMKTQHPPRFETLDLPTPPERAHRDAGHRNGNRDRPPPGLGCSDQPHRPTPRGPPAGALHPASAPPLPGHETCRDCWPPHLEPPDR